MPTRTEKIEIKPGAATGDRGAALVPLPLRFPGIERLQPGVYAEKIVMEGRWAPGRGGVHPLRVERWIYFRVDRGRVERLSIEEYSAIADPPDVARDAGGGAALIHRGGDTKTDQRSSDHLIRVLKAAHQTRPGSCPRTKSERAH